jgi:hypothetical protein
MPLTTRSMMVARSNSANTPRSCTSIRPVAVEVSMGSVAERKATPAASNTSSSPTSTFRERAKRSTR